MTLSPLSNRLPPMFYARGLGLCLSRGTEALRLNGVLGLTGPTRAAPQELQRIWSQVLCIPHAQVLLNVPFIEYGGDSLLAIEVLSHAARARLQLGPAAALTPNFEMVRSILSLPPSLPPFLSPPPPSLSLGVCVC